MNCIAMLLMLLSGHIEPLNGVKWEKPMVAYIDCTFNARNVYVCKP